MPGVQLSTATGTAGQRCAPSDAAACGHALLLLVQLTVAPTSSRPRRSEDEWLLGARADPREVISKRSTSNRVFIWALLGAKELAAPHTKCRRLHKKTTNV